MVGNQMKKVTELTEQSFWSKRLERKHLAMFRCYERYWHTVLVGVLRWPEEAFVDFVERREGLLRQIGPGPFFHDLPYKYVCHSLVPVKMRRKLPGGDGIEAAYRLFDALCDNDHEAVSGRSFDTKRARGRYLRTLAQIESHLDGN
jgi:hypothetical protein